MHVMLVLFVKLLNNCIFILKKNTKFKIYITKNNERFARDKMWRENVWEINYWWNFNLGGGVLLLSGRLLASRQSIIGGKFCTSRIRVCFGGIRRLKGC